MLRAGRRVGGATASRGRGGRWVANERRKMIQPGGRTGDVATGAGRCRRCRRERRHRRRPEPRTTDVSGVPARPWWWIGGAPRGRYRRFLPGAGWADPAGGGEGVAYCAVCPVRAECLSDALEHGSVYRFGIKAGMRPGGTPRPAASHNRVTTRRGNSGTRRRASGNVTPACGTFRGRVDNAGRPEIQSRLQVDSPSGANPPSVFRQQAGNEPPAPTDDEVAEWDANLPPPPARRFLALPPWIAASRVFSLSGGPWRSTASTSW